jgi:hypothetical protein
MFSSEFLAKVVGGNWEEKGDRVIFSNEIFYTIIVHTIKCSRSHFYRDKMNSKSNQQHDCFVDLSQLLWDFEITIKM